MLALVVLATPVFLGPQHFGSVRLAPDGRRAIFIAEATPLVPELFITSTDGSTSPVRLSAPLVAGGGVQPAAFSLDGARVLYAADQDHDDVSELYSVPSTGGAPVKLHEPLAGQRDLTSFSGRWFTLTPDGSRVVFALSRGPTGVPVELYSAPLDGSAAEIKLSGTLVSGGSVTAYEVSADGTRVVFVADAQVNNQFEAWSAPVDGSSPPVLLSTLGGNVTRVGIAPDSARVVYTAPEVFSAPIDGSAAPVQLGTETGVFTWCFTPDAQRVVYAGTTEVASARLDGSSSIVLFESTDVWQVEVTSDGATCVFIAQSILGEYNLYGRPVDGSAPVHALAREDLLSFQLTTSGRRVVFTRGDIEHNLKSVDVAGLEPVQTLSADNVTAFHLVPGRERAVFTTDDPFLPTQPELHHVGANGAEPESPLGPGRILALGADRSKRSVAGFPGAAPTRTGLLLFAAPGVGGEELFAQPWDGSTPAVRIGP